MYLLACWAEVLFAANSPATSSTVESITLNDRAKTKFFSIVSDREDRINDGLGINEGNKLPLGD